MQDSKCEQGGSLLTNLFAIAGLYGDSRQVRRSEAESSLGMARKVEEEQGACSAWEGGNQNDRCKRSRLK